MNATMQKPQLTTTAVFISKKEVIPSKAWLLIPGDCSLATLGDFSAIYGKNAAFREWSYKMGPTLISNMELQRSGTVQLKGKDSFSYVDLTEYWISGPEKRGLFEKGQGYTVAYANLDTAKKNIDDINYGSAMSLFVSANADPAQPVHVAYVKNNVGMTLGTRLASVLAMAFRY